MTSHVWAGEDQKLSWEQLDALLDKQYQQTLQRYTELEREYCELMQLQKHRTPEAAASYQRLSVQGARLAGVMVRHQEFAESALAEAAFSAQKATALTTYERATARFSADFVASFLESAQAHAARRIHQASQTVPARGVKARALRALLGRMEITSENLTHDTLETIGLRDWPQFESAERKLRGLVSARDLAEQKRHLFSVERVHPLVRWFRKLGKRQTRERAALVQGVKNANDTIASYLTDRKGAVMSTLREEDSVWVGELSFVLAPETRSSRELGAANEARWKAFCEGADLPYDPSHFEARLELIDRYLRGLKEKQDQVPCSDALQ